MKRLSVFLMCLVFTTVLFAEGQNETAQTVEEWEQWAQIGDFKPAVDDWDAIEKAAKEEEPLVIYSNSSRVYEFGRTFYQKYGIKIEPNDLNTPDLLEKVVREQDAGIFNADLILVDDIPTVYNEFYALGRIYKFIPSNLKTLLIDGMEDEPLNIHHYGARGIAYNTDTYSEPPIDSWWDLTRPEWKGKIVMKDPLKSGAEFNTFATFIQHHVEMEEAYQDEFGEELIKSDGVENAGYEFLKRLMDNGLVLMASSGPVMSAIATPGQENPPLGILGYSKLRTIEEENLTAAFVEDLSPVTGFRTTTVMGIAAFSKSPNSAKLMIKWMMGDDQPSEDLAGFVPFHTIGNWSVRTDIEEPKGQKPISEMNFYKEDADWLYKNSIKVKDFWMQHQ